MFDFFRYSNVWIAIYEDKSVCHLELNKIIHEVIVLENVHSNPSLIVCAYVHIVLPELIISYICRQL